MSFQQLNGLSIKIQLRVMDVSFIIMLALAKILSSVNLLTDP